MSNKETEDVLTILTKIETLEDLEEHKTVIVDLVIGELRSGLDALKMLTDTSLSPEELETKITSVQGGRESLEKEMEKELDRISKIPGAEEAVMSLRGEMMGQMGSLANEMAQLMAQLMGNPLGGAMGDMMGEIGVDFEATTETFDDYELPEGETIEALEFVKSIESAEDYQAKEKEFVNKLEEMYKTELKSAQELKSAELPYKEFKQRIHTLKSRQNYIINEMENVFAQLEEKPGMKEYLDKCDDDELLDMIAKRIESTIDELMQTLSELDELAMKCWVNGGGEEVAVEAKEEIYCPVCEYMIDDDTPDHCTYCGLHLEDWYEGCVRLDMLGTLYETRTLDDLNENKDDIIEYLEQDLQDDLYELEIFDSPEIINDRQEKIEKIQKRLDSIDKELEVHFTRLKGLLGAAETAEALESELTERIGPKLNEMREHMARIKKVV